MLLQPRWSGRDDLLLPSFADCTIRNSLPSRGLACKRKYRTRKDSNLVVLVIGGAGYIGSHTARALRRAGHQVTIFDNLSTGYETLAAGFKLIRPDVLDSSALARA